MALTNITQPTANIQGTNNLTNITTNDAFYVHFDPAKDIISNNSKKYIQDIVPENTSTTVTILDATSTESICQHKYNSKTILTACSGSSTGIVYKPIQSLLRTYNQDWTEKTWIPVSSSDFNVQANYATIISFSNDIIGDKLSFGQSSDEFVFTHSTTEYKVIPANQFTGVTFDIKPQFKNQSTNFGLVMTDTSDITTTKGLFFGELGLIIMYSSSNNTINPATLFNLKNVVRQQRLNSKTYFCRITNQKYNASSNPTWAELQQDIGYLTIRNSQDPFTAITTIGLYNDNNELLAVAKLSQPTLKQIDSQLHAKIVLQY